LTDKLIVALLVAMPPLSATGFPKLPPSIVNWMVPVGVPLPLWGVTIAVKVTLWPNTDGLWSELTAVMVPTGAGRLTTWPPESVPLLFMKLLSPL